MDAESDIEYTKKLALTIKESIETSDHEQRCVMFEELYDKWIIKNDDIQVNMFDYLKIALNNFGLEADNLQIGTFERAKKIVKFQLNYLHAYFMNDVELDTDKELKDEINTKFNKLYTAVIDAENAIQYSLYLKSSMTLEYIGTVSKNIFRFNEIDYEDNIPYQNLLLYLMESIKKCGYRRYDKLNEKGGSCYQRIYTKDGYDTHAWKKAMTIREFILDVTRKDFNYNMWKNLTSSKDNLRAATMYLTEYLGCEFEDLVKDRNVFSFRNGIYISSIYNEQTETFRDEWIPYVGRKSKPIGATIVACKYFDCDFVDCSDLDDWYDIIKTHCPNFMHIMSYQRWPEDVQRWLCILIGRLLYNVSDKDDWQCIPYLLGNAGTGKSTILIYIIKLFYDNADIGILSNNIESKFGLGPLAHKTLILGPEIKGDLQLEQSEFQSMISGEDLQLNIKYQGATSIKWPVPMILAGNLIPQYSDNAGSITRRIVVFPFDFKIRQGDGDSKLKFKLEKEISFILQACNRSYLEAIDKYGSSDIWTILPEPFKKTRQVMAENTNSLSHFLNSENIKIGKDLYVREKLFIVAFNEHCKENHLTPYKWSNQYYNGPFSDYGITINKNCRRRYPNVSGEKSYNGTFIFGCDLSNHENYVLDSDDEEEEEA
jgi:hypothetical protein